MQLNQLIQRMRERVSRYPDNEDVDIRSVLTNRGYVNSAEQRAADDFIENAIAEFALGLGGSDIEDRNVERTAPELVHKTNQLAQFTAAWRAFGTMRALRTRRNQHAMMQAIRAEDATPGTEQMLNDYSNGDKISTLDLMKFEVDRRYANTDWRRMVGETQMTAASMSRELAQMLSVQDQIKHKIEIYREQHDLLRSLEALVPLAREQHVWLTDKTPQPETAATSRAKP